MFIYSDQPKEAYEKIADSLMRMYPLNISKRNKVKGDMNRCEGNAI